MIINLLIIINYQQETSDELIGNGFKTKREHLNTLHRFTITTFGNDCSPGIRQVIRQVGLSVVTSHDGFQRQLASEY